MDKVSPYAHIEENIMKFLFDIAENPKARDRWVKASLVLTVVLGVIYVVAMIFLMR